MRSQTTRNSLPVVNSISCKEPSPTSNGSIRHSRLAEVNFAKTRQNKKPGLSTGLFALICKISLRGFVRDSGVVAVDIGIGLIAVGLAVRVGIGLRLGAAARALGELTFDFLHGFRFRHMLDDRDLAGQAIERRFVQLAFAIGLLGLR